MFCKRIAAIIFRRSFTTSKSKASSRSTLRQITRHSNNHTNASSFYSGRVSAQFLSTKPKKAHILAVERLKNSQAYFESRLSIMKLETPSFKEIFTPELDKLIKLFTTYGAVRDLVLGKIPHDIDFATTATPDEMKAMFEKESIRMINAKGESHGTITCRINDKVC